MAEHFQEAVESGNPSEYIRELMEGWQRDYDERRTTFRMDQREDTADED
jgi:hypothetical protein